MPALGAYLPLAFGACNAPVAESDGGPVEREGIGLIQGGTSGPVVLAGASREDDAAHPKYRVGQRACLRWIPLDKPADWMRLSVVAQ